MASASSGSTPMMRIFGKQILDVGRDARDQPAAADRHEDGIDFSPGTLAQDLHADRALTGNDIRIVEGMNERERRSRASISACS